MFFCTQIYVIGSMLKIRSLPMAYNNVHEINIDSLLNHSISKVLLPNELTASMKHEISATKKSVYTNPDLYVKVDNGNNKIDFVSIKLKTTKTNQIPGSSVQQILPFEWVIFIKHDKETIKVACGFYINSITDRLPFPDRSPRPIIGFDTLKKWNKHNRTMINGVLKYKINEQSEVNKSKILDNWEKVLCDEWLDTIMKDSRKSEKWFNNTIRMYTLYLLEKIKKNPQLIDMLYNKIKKNIKKR